MPATSMLSFTAKCRPASGPAAAASAARTAFSATRCIQTGLSAGSFLATEMFKGGWRNLVYKLECQIPRRDCASAKSLNSGRATISGRTKTGQTKHQIKAPEAVYQQIKMDIFEFRLLPGARFSENEIAARARVSRTPVREALLRLQREGFVDVLAKSGWRVRDLDFDRFEHLYDARIVLELDAVRKLCVGEMHEGDPLERLAALKKAWL